LYVGSIGAGLKPCYSQAELKLKSRKGEVIMAERETGTVKWFNAIKGYGFIEGDRGGDVFVYYNNIRGTGYRSLDEGLRVEFTVIQAAKGPQALDVVVVG
jgi:CspA family cold shock protein